MLTKRKTPIGPSSLFKPLNWSSVFFQRVFRGASLCLSLPDSFECLDKAFASLSVTSVFTGCIYAQWRKVFSVLTCCSQPLCVRLWCVCVCVCVCCVVCVFIPSPTLKKFLRGGVVEGAGWEIREDGAGMWLFLASLQQFVCVVHAYIPIIKNLIVNSLFLEERLLNIIRRGPAFISSAVRCCQKTCWKLADEVQTTAGEQSLAGVLELGTVLAFVQGNAFE